MATFSERFLRMLNELNNEEVQQLIWHYAAQATLGDDDAVCEVLEQDIETIRWDQKGDDELERDPGELPEDSAATG